MPWQGKSPTEQLGLLWGPFNNRPVFDKVSSKYTSCSGELRDFEFAVTGLSTAKKHSSRKQQPASSLLWEAKLHVVLLGLEVLHDVPVNGDRPRPFIQLLQHIQMLLPFNAEGFRLLIMNGRLILIQIDFR